MLFTRVKAVSQGWKLIFTPVCNGPGLKKIPLERISSEDSFSKGILCRFYSPLYFKLPTFSKYSAICTAFKAAPFLIWSLTVQNVKPFGLLISLRMRPT